MFELLITDSISVSTRGDAEVIDLTEGVRGKVDEHRLAEGQVLIFVSGSTAAVTTVEHEPGLVQDLPEFFERIAPRHHRYHHEERWHDGNGHSHVRASLLGPSLLVPVSAGRPLLGTWQQIVLIDFDNKPRQREIVVQLSGRRSLGRGSVRAAGCASVSGSAEEPP
jgi:secondary thiamine-phosphate synthase enzyme